MLILMMVTMLQGMEFIPPTPNMPDNHVMARVARQENYTHITITITIQYYSTITVISGRRSGHLVTEPHFLCT